MIMLRKINFEKALKNDSCVIIKGDKVKHLKGIKFKNRIEYIKSKTPMPFSKICETITENYGHLGYIDFWDNTVDIYQCI